MKPTSALVLAGVAAALAGDAGVELQTAPPANPSTQRDLEAAALGAVVASAVSYLARGKRGLGTAALIGAGAGFVGGRVGFPGVKK